MPATRVRTSIARPMPTIFSRACSRRAPLWRPFSMSARVSFDYAVVRVVPRVERDEFLNVGVIVHSPTRRYLATRIELDVERLRALAPEVDPEEVQRFLDAFARTSAGDDDAGPV